MILAGWTAIVLALAASAVEFTDAQNNADVAYLPQSAESLAAIKLEQKAFGDELLTGLLAFQNPAGLTRQDKLAIRKATLALTRQPLEGQLGKPVPIFFEDGKSAAIYTQLRAYGEKEILFAASDRLHALAATAPPDMTVKLTGQAGFFNDSASILDSIDRKLLIGTVVLVALLLLLIYRSPFLWLLPLVSVGFAEMTSRGLGTQLSESGVTVTSQSAALMTVLVFGVGTDYALLVIARYREELRRTDDIHQAMSDALAKTGPTILASAATVIAALLCLTLADVNATSGAGPIGAMGIAVSMLAMLTMLPAFLLVCGRGVFWPKVPAVGDPEPTESPGIWTRLADGIAEKPWRVIILSFALMAVMALGLTSRPGGLDLTKSFHQDVESVEGMEMLAAALPPGATGPLTILVSDPRQVPRVVRSLQRAPDIATVGVPQVGNGAARIEASLKYPPYSDAAMDAVTRVRDRMQRVAHGSALVAGAPAVEADSRHFAVEDNKLIMPLVLLVVFVVLILLLRSLVAPVLLMITVVASFLAVMGASYWAFQHIFSFPGVDEYVPLFVFIFLVALGVDYNIFLMARVREEAAKFGAREGVRRGLVVTGGVITSAGIVLAGTFFVMAAMPLTMLTEIGFAIAVGVLFDALIVRTALVPALGFALGKRIWWPSNIGDERIAPLSAPAPVGVVQPAHPGPPQVVPPEPPRAPSEPPRPEAPRISGSSRYR